MTALGWHIYKVGIATFDANSTLTKIIFFIFNTKALGTPKQA
jgi:hypothetical protein